MSSAAEIEVKQKTAETEVNIEICEDECRCCMDKIYSLIKDDAKESDEMRFAETPLHKAAEAGNTAVAVEILNLMPSLGRKLNKEGLSPLHLAIREKRRETAVRMARFEKQLVRVKGWKGMTPLMECAAKEDRELLAKLLLACPESVLDVNNENQTVVHVALVNQRCDTVCVLVDWLRRRDRIAAVLSVKDHWGNTALHAAAQFGCFKGAQKILSLVKLNRLNAEKKTALDVGIEHKQNEVVKILKDKGAKSGSEIFAPETRTEYVLAATTFPEAVSRFYYNLSSELTLEMRNAILVVAALIVAATYQGVLQPPGGVYPPPDNSNTTTTNENTRLLSCHYSRHPHMGRRLQVSNNALQKHLAGRMVMEEAHYRYFMPSNTFAFALSTVIIIFVIPSSPIFVILLICLVFMSLSYLLALVAISQYTGLSHMIFYMAVYAIFGAYFVKLVYYPIKALLVDKDWWLRLFSVTFANYASGAKWTRAVPVMEMAHKMKKQYQVLSLE